jgi:hypothetical protein
MKNCCVKYTIVRFLVLLFLISSCKKPDEVKWNTQMKAPLAKVSFGINDLLVDSGLVVHSDQSVSLNYKKEIYKINPLDSLFDITVDAFVKTITIEELQLSDLSINENYTLEQVIDDAGLSGIVSNGASIHSSLLNGLTGISRTPIAIDITEYFEKAVLSKGFLDLVIDNQLPLDITNMDFSIINESDGLIVFTKNIDFIASATTYEDLNYDLATALAGNEIEGSINVVITNVEFTVPSGDNFVTIDYTDFLSFGIALHGLKVESATAIFPSQVVTDQTEEILIVTTDNVELKSAIMQSGQVHVNVKSTIPTELFLHYEIPSATLNGKIYSFDKSIPAATGGNTVNVSDNFPMKDYLFDFTGLSGTEVNTFFNSAQLSIKPT